MSKIKVFSKKEKRILDEIFMKLHESYNQAILDYLKQRKDAIEKLAESISLYPPILDNPDDISSIYESVEEQIIELANSKSEEYQFNVPSKAILGKSFLIAKVNFFYLCYYFSRDIYPINDYQEKIISIINEIIIMLMAEEVFIEIVMDDSISPFSKTKAVKLLFEVWEYRLTLGVKKFVPLLVNMWEARKSFEPAYGTLMGTAEHFMFASNVDEKIMNFINKYNFEDEEEYSVLEFLFGLSYENLIKLKEKMKIENISVVRKEEILRMLEMKKLYSGSAKEDPRSFYSFFIMRKNDAIYRSHYKQKGPKKTLEEHIMLFALDNNDL